jgi:hypothetical protein
MSTWETQDGLGNNRGTIFFRGGSFPANDETASSMASIGDLNGDGVRWSILPSFSLVVHHMHFFCTWLSQPHRAAVGLSVYLCSVLCVCVFVCVCDESQTGREYIHTYRHTQMAIFFYVCVCVCVCVCVREGVRVGGR